MLGQLIRMRYYQTELALETNFLLVLVSHEFIIKRNASSSRKVSFHFSPVNLEFGVFLSFLILIDDRYT